MQGDRKLVKYIKKQLNAGYTRGEIVTHLVKSGHKREFVEKNFEIAIKPKTEFVKKIVEFLSIVALAVLIFWIGFSSNAPFGSVIAGFLPAILSLIFLISVVETGRHKEWMWAMPVAFTIAFIILGVAKAPLFSKMQIGKLAFLNLIISYIFLIIINYPEAYKKEEHSEPKEEEKDIEHHFSAIEDKCKALNFVIGRVYRSSNGGTTSMRDEIRISSDLYNEFQRLVKEGTKDEMLKVLDGIGDSILKLQKTEKEVFGSKAGHLKNLIRDEHGNSRIIDVLAKNDNDPVMNYYSDALDAYNEIRKKTETLNVV